MDDGQRLLRGGRPFATTTHHRQQRQTAVTSGCEPPVAAADGTIVPSPHSFDPTGRLRQVEHGAIYVVIVEQVVLAQHTRVNRHRRSLWVVLAGLAGDEQFARSSCALWRVSTPFVRLGWIRRGILPARPDRPAALGVTALLLGHEPQQEPRLFRCSAGGDSGSWLTACRSTSGVDQVLRTTHGHHHWWPRRISDILHRLHPVGITKLWNGWYTQFRKNWTSKY